MNTVKYGVVMCVFAASCLSAQTTIDARTQTKSIDFSGAPSTTPAKVGTALPATCSIGASFFKSNAPVGQNLYGCTATNAWTLLGAVTTVFGRGGGVTAQEGDYSLVQLSDVTAKQGNGTVVPMFGSGSVLPNDCAMFDTNGNLADAGGPCGSTASLPAQTGSSAVLLSNGTTASWGNLSTGPSGALDCVDFSGACDVVPAIVPLKANANVWTGSDDFSASPFLVVPSSAGAAPTANGRIAYDTTANQFKGGANGSTVTLLAGVNGTANQIACSAPSVGVVTCSLPSTINAPGVVNLPTTTNSVGQLQINSTVFAHASSGSTYLGLGAGNPGGGNTGTTVVGIGNSDLSANGVGSNTVAIGYQAMQTGTSSSTVAIGAQALQSSTGFGNVAIGSQALISNSSGAGNSAIGQGSLGSNSTGSSNVAVGREAGNANSSFSATNANTSGSQNTFIGSFALPSTATQLTDAVAIGYNAEVGCSNCAVIGGTSADAVVLGVNTTTPTVSGTGHIHISGNTARVMDTARTPASSSEACNPGEVFFDATYLYVCTASATIKRLTLATF